MRWGLFLGIAAIAAIPHLLGTLRTSWLVAWIGIILLLGLVARWRAPQWLLAVLAMVIPVELFDLGLRTVGDDILYYNMSGRHVRRRPEAEDLWNYHKNVVDTLKTYGDATDMGGRSDATEDHEVYFETDAYGFRNTSEASREPVELILLGDSFGAAANTTQAKGLASRLGESVRTYNLSVSGAGPREHLLTLRLELDRVPVADGATLVWLLFEGNDLEETSPDDLEIHPEPGVFRRLRAGLKEFRKRSPVRQLGKRLLSALEPERPLPIRREQLADGSPLHFYSAYDQRRTREDMRAHKKFPAFKLLFAQLADEVKQRQIATLVVVAPTKDRVYPTSADGSVTPGGLAESTTGFAAEVNDLCDTHELPCFDLLPPLSAEAARLWEESRELLWWRDDTHWNEHGHAVAAAAIAEHLRPAP
jgi:lysophospholipase L1-like esterase